MAIKIPDDLELVLSFCDAQEALFVEYVGFAFGVDRGQAFDVLDRIEEKVKARRQAVADLVNLNRGVVLLH